MKKIYALTALLSLFLLSGCSKDNNETPLTPKDRLLLEYVIADGADYQTALAYINRLEKDWSDAEERYHVIYLYPPAAGSEYATGTGNYNEKPRLLLIQRDSDPVNMNSRILKEYSRSQNPDDPSTMEQILADAQNIVPVTYYTADVWSASGAGPALRTVINYIVADNNLYPYSETNINQMEAGWKPYYNANMVVYLHPVAKTSVYAPSYDGYDETPRLLLINADSDPNTMNSQVLKTYSRNQDPCDPEVMRSVLADAMALAPANSYAVNFWSHGRGWLPKEITVRSSGSTPSTPAISKLEGADTPIRAANGITGYSFGGSISHNSSEIDIDEMNDVLASFPKFDFIMFDACFMSCIEVAYELRDRADFLIASAAEILAGGFPYTEIMKYMVTEQADVQNIAKAFYDYYNSRSGSWRTGTIAVVDNSRLEELAASVKALADQGLIGTLSAAQQYGRYGTYNNVFYDFQQLTQNAFAGSDASLLNAFEQALSNAVVYKAATPSLFDDGYSSTGVKIVNHSGFSAYIPRTTQSELLNAYRTRFQWSTDSGMGALVQ